MRAQPGAIQKMSQNNVRRGKKFLAFFISSHARIYRGLLTDSRTLTRGEGSG